MLTTKFAENVTLAYTYSFVINYTVGTRIKKKKKNICLLVNSINDYSLRNPVWDIIVLDFLSIS